MLRLELNDVFVVERTFATNSLDVLNVPIVDVPRATKCIFSRSPIFPALSFASIVITYVPAGLPDVFHVVEYTPPDKVIVSGVILPFFE